MSSLKWLLVLVVLTISVFGASQASAQNIIDPIDSGIAITQISGYAHLYYLPESETRPRADKIGLPDDESDYQFGLFRIKAESFSKDVPDYGAAYEIEAVDLDDPDKNWLRQAYLSYKLNDEWAIRAGRLFLAAGYITPAPSGLETVLYPRTPFTCYAYGMQMKGKFDDTLSIVADITGKSGVSFNDSENWDGLESSVRLSERFTSNLTLSVTLQLSDDSTVGAIDSEYRVGKLLLRGAAYSKCLEDAATGVRGFYAYGGYEIFRRFELHAQVDRQIGENNIWTIGARIWTPNDQVSLTADYEVVDGQHDDNRFVARIETRF
jgi:hypothetical protein